MRPSPCKASGTQRGHVLIISLVMVAIAGIAIGSMLNAQITYSRNCEAMYRHEKATFLADAGLHAAVVKLNADAEGNISTNASRTYFTETNTLTAPDWSFDTRVVVTNGRNLVVATGRYGGKLVEVQAEVTLGAGNRSVHALYAHALFAGNSSMSTNYVMKIGGAGLGADFVRGDVYSGHRLERTGDAKLRLPEWLNDTNSDGICDLFETWTNAYAVMVFTSGLSQAAYSAYSNTLGTNLANCYNNGRYDFGEAFRDTMGGNGVYDPWETFTDTDGDGVRDTGDGFIDCNGNGVYDAGETVVDHGNGQYDTGEEWVEDSVRKYNNKKVRVNGRWDEARGYWQKVSGVWQWKHPSACSSWPAESYEDVGDGVYQPAEPYDDGNGIYDPGEQFIDDRNSIYDYGTQATGPTTGMPTPAAGQRAAPGGDARIDPPDLSHMYYSENRNGLQPPGALSRWGNDVAVTSNDYGSAIAITDSSRPEHIFIRNPPIGTSGSVSSGGKTIYKRSYTPVYDASGGRVDDYFFEDPTDSSYNSYVMSGAIDGTVYTAPMYVNVRSDANVKLYYVDGNLYIHHPQVYCMRFRQPGTRITIVAKGNITLSDEFYYNAAYPSGLDREDVNSTIVYNPSDAFCLIALKNPACPTNSGNIYIGDAQFGTGGSIHAMLYAENDFVDNNLNTSDQAFISIFGNMTAGNEVSINRSGSYRTRLDVTLDERIRNGEVIVPGLPHPVGSQRSIILTTAWQMVPGTWSSWSKFR